MKKLMIMAVIGTAVGLCLLPQASLAARLEGGLKFGANIAFIHGPDVEIFPGLDSNWLIRFGLCGGGFVALSLSERIAIQAEALITTKGSKEIRPLFEDYETYVYSLMITYLEIPVLFRVTTPPIWKVSQLVFMAGPAFGFKLGSRFMRSGEVLDFDGVRSSDLGLVFSFGYVLRSKGYTEFRYTAGMSKVIERGGIPLNIKNGVVSLIVGYRF